MLKNTVSGGEEGVEKVLEVLLELQHQLSTVYNPIQELLEYVDAENCRNPSCNTVCTVYNAQSVHQLRPVHHLSTILATMQYYCKRNRQCNRQ